MNKPRIIAGLTGGIASGKSTVAEMFRAQGAYIIDADVVSRTVSAAEDVIAELKKAFPFAFTGGKLNRAALRKHIFSDEGEREKLNAIMHPRIYRETERLIASADAPVVVLVVPLLFEAGFDRLTDVNIVVSCNHDTRIERLTKRDAIGKGLAEKMVRSQLTEEERLARADIIINNNGTEAMLRAEVIRLYCKLSA